MTASELIAALAPLVPNASFEEAPSVDFATVYVPADRLVDTCRALRDSLGFTRWTPPAIPRDSAVDDIPASRVVDASMMQRFARRALGLRQTAVGRVLYRMAPSPLIDALKARLGG